MKLTNSELDDILATAGLEIAQPYSASGKYRKDKYLFTCCKRYGIETHYRLKYILDNNGRYEKTCRACFWMGWYGRSRSLQHAGIKDMLDHDASLDDLIDQGAVTPSQAMGLADARKLAAENGYELVDLLRGDRPGDDLLVVRCRACGKQTVERPGDMRFGCSCGGRSKGVAYGSEAVKVERNATPVAADENQDSSPRFLVGSGYACLAWWDADANGGSVPSDLTSRSRQDFWWKCPECGCRFRAPVYTMTSSPRCPVCAAKRSAEFEVEWKALDHMTAVDFPDLLAAWDDAHDPRTLPVTSYQLVHLCCPKGHHPTQTLYSYLSNGWMVCRGIETKASPDKEYLATTDSELAAEWVRPRDGGNWTPHNIEDGSKRFIVWRCIACGHEWEATVHARQLRMNNRCLACGKVMGSLAWKYPQLAAEWSPSNPISPWNTKPFGNLGFISEWVCSKNPEHVWRMTTATRINKGRGCPFCEKEEGEQG